MPPQEVDGKRLGDIGAELTRQNFPLTVANENRIPIAALDVLVERDRFFVRLAVDDVVKTLLLGGGQARKIDAARPDQMLIKAVLREDVRLVVEIVDLPFAGDAGRVAGGFEQSRKDDFAPRIEPSAAIQ